jgi:lipopolysaccharide transport system permease protein
MRSSAIELLPVDQESLSTPSTVAADPSDVLPLTVLEPRSRWHLLDIKELWKYRELLYFLAWRDIKVRFKQTVLGAAWAILQPLVTMLVFTLFLGQVAGQPASEIPYPLFVFAGLLPWILFSGVISSASQSIVGSQNLVTKVYFPRFLIPLGASGAILVDFAIAFVLLLLMMAGYQTPPGWSVFLLPLVVLLLIVAALGVGTLLSALTVRYRDFRHVVPFLVQVWMFATPSIYLQSNLAIGARWQAVLPLNPAYGLIVTFRQTLLGLPLDSYALAVSGGASLVLLAVGCFYFRWVERSFADVI